MENNGNASWAGQRQPLTRKRAMVTMFAIVLLLLAVIAGFYVLRGLMGGAAGMDIRSGTGTWDLRAVDGGQGDYVLRGPVEHISGALLTPAEFAAREGEAVLGSPPAGSSGPQFATSRLRILVPDDGYYSFSRRSIDYSHRVYANGTLVAEMGRPGETRETNVPDSGNVYFTVKAVDGVIELVQQASNFVHRAGGGHDGWSVSARDLNTHLAYAFSDSFIMWSYLSLFIIHILLLLLPPDYKGNLFFALFCFIWFLRMGVTGPKLFTVFFPQLPWEVKFRIEYLTIPVTAILLVTLLNILFPNILQKWFRYALYGVSALFAGVFLFADTVFMSYALLWIEAMYVPAIVYIIVRFAVKLRGMYLEHCIFLAGVFVFFLAVINDMFYFNDYFGLLPKAYHIHHMASIAMLLFTYCQAAAMFIVTVQMMKTSVAEDIFRQYGLTSREIEVANLLLTEGLSAGEIGERLFISARTVNTHIASIYRKFNVKKLGEFMTLFVKSK